jgi:hypothetical protein
MTSQPEIAQRAAGRGLLPREHGAYLELLFSLSTALALGNLHAAQLLLAIGAIAAFLAHEPALIMLGERGRRALDQFRDRAALAAAALLAAAILAAAAGWWLANTAARLAVLIPLVFAAALIPLVFTHREKTAVGELLVALTFSSALVPIALAGDARLEAAVIAGAVWAVIFSLQTSVVRNVIGGAKENLHSRRSFAFAAWSGPGVVLIGWLLSTAGFLPVLAAAAIVPTALIALTCSALRIHPRHLRRIGRSFAASNLLALAALIAALR